MTWPFAFVKHVGSAHSACELLSFPVKQVYPGNVFVTAYVAAMCLGGLDSCLIHALGILQIAKKSGDVSSTSSTPKQTAGHTSHIWFPKVFESLVSSTKRSKTCSKGDKPGKPRSLVVTIVWSEIVQGQGSLIFF